MGILVCYDDFTYDVINDDYHLQYLLDKGCIVGYDNSGKWVKSEAVSEEVAEPPGAGQSSHPESFLLLI